MVGLGAESIKDRESFRAWLRALPEADRREAAVALASRCALRLVPFLGKRGNMWTNNFVSLLKYGFLLNSLTHSERIWPHIDTKSSALRNSRASGYSAATDMNYDDSADPLAYAAAVAVDAAIDAMAFDLYFASAAPAAIDATADAHAVALDIWETIRADAALIETGDKGITLYALPLWRNVPTWWVEELKSFKNVLDAKDLVFHGFNIWLEWYEPLAQGLPIFKLKDPKAADALECAIALGGKDGEFHVEFWEREPSEINREIAEWVREERVAETLRDAEVAGPGLSWFPTSLHYELVISGDATDADVAGQAETAFEHSKLNARLSALSKMATTISARRGWEQFQDICGELTSAIAVPTVELHTRILQIYDASLMLASLLDYNNKLVADRGGNEFRPLQADESLALQQVVMTVAPWIGRFPTAKRKDTEAGQMFSRMSDEAIFAHVKFVNQVQSAGLISEQDRKMLQTLLEALLKFGNTLSAPAEKAQAHGQGTVRKLTFAMALIVSNALSAASGAVGVKIVEDVVSETQTYKSTVKFLRDPLTELENIVKELPPHLRLAFESVLQRLKREVPEMPTPEPIADVAKRRPIPRRK